MIKILVDSASDCTRGNPVYDYLIPLTVTVDEVDYKDGVNLSADRFFRLLASAKAFPKTAQPSPEDYLKCFQQVRDDGDELICFTMSSALSGTCQSANIARQMLGYDGIHIIDTLTVTHTIGFLADYTAKRIREGACAGQIAEECEALKGKLRVYAGLDTLEYLHKGGRLSRVGAVAGSLAGIKPVVTTTPEGKVGVCGKAIGVPRAMGVILSKLKSCRIDSRFPVYGIYTDSPHHLKTLEQKLADIHISLAGYRQVGPAIGAHVGPGVYGVVFVEA